MGMFDSVLVICSICGTKVEFQSKAGECLLREYTPENTPPEISLNLRGETEICPTCGCEVEFPYHSELPDISIICDKCEGSGRLRYNTMTEENKYKFGSIECDQCVGTGTSQAIPDQLRESIIQFLELNFLADTDDFGVTEVRRLQKARIEGYNLAIRSLIEKFRRISDEDKED